MKFTILSAFIASLVQAEALDVEATNFRRSIPWEMAQNAEKNTKHNHGKRQYSDHRRQVPKIEGQTSENLSEMYSEAAPAAPVKTAAVPAKPHHHHNGAAQQSSNSDDLKKAVSRATAKIQKRLQNKQEQQERRKLAKKKQVQKLRKQYVDSSETSSQSDDE